MRVYICGNTKTNSIDDVWNTLLSQPNIRCIAHPNRNHVDNTANVYAEEMGIDLRIYQYIWNRSGTNLTQHAAMIFGEYKPQMVIVSGSGYFEDFMVHHAQKNKIAVIRI